MFLAFGDSHRYSIALAEMAEIIRRQQPQFFVHTGDNYQDFQRLQKTTGLQGYGVRGNCDRNLPAEVPEELVLSFHGFSIFLTHGHQYGVKHCLNLLVERARDLGAQAVIFGHSHVQLVQEEEGILLVNPGSIPLPRGNSESGYAEIFVKNGKLQAELRVI